MAVGALKTHGLNAPEDIIRIVENESELQAKTVLMATGVTRSDLQEAFDLLRQAAEEKNK